MALPLSPPHPAHSNHPSAFPISPLQHLHSRGLLPLPEPGTAVPSPWGCLAAHALCILPADTTRGAATRDLWGLTGSQPDPQPILQGISAPGRINTPTHRESGRAPWHKLKPSINSQAGFAASLGQGPAFQVSATSLKEARQGRETGTGW